MKPFVLHLANDFSGSRVYNQLVGAIDRKGVKQLVFTTIRSEGERGRNNVSFTVEDSFVYYSDNWRPFHRLSFRAKTESNYKHLLRVIDPGEVTHVHAHTLFSDGAIALRLKRNFGIPYTVTIRNTDLNTFMRFMVHTWSMGRSVMSNADRIVCISPAHMERARRWCMSPWKDFDQKVVNIPNGVDSYWLDHLDTSTRIAGIDEPWRILYIGNFTPNKNLPRLMEAIRRIHRLHDSDVELHVVGGNGADDHHIRTLASAEPDLYHLHGVIKDKGKLRDIMHHCNLYAMPSLHETFGLVYVEALSQGLPILYTEGEGVDGFFASSYGEKCDPTDISSIADKIMTIIRHFDSYRIDPDYLLHCFDWDSVADRYLSLFRL